MRIVKHAKYSLHISKRGKVTDKQFYNACREGDTVCGYWLDDNFRELPRYSWHSWAYTYTKKIHVARCIRRVTCKLCLRNAAVKAALKKTETKPSQK